jgi:hypothetical protein
MKNALVLLVFGAFAPLFALGQIDSLPSCGVSSTFLCLITFLPYLSRWGSFFSSRGASSAFASCKWLRLELVGFNSPQGACHRVAIALGKPQRVEKVLVASKYLVSLHGVSSSSPQLSTPPGQLVVASPEILELSSRSPSGG